MVKKCFYTLVILLTFYGCARINMPILLPQVAIEIDAPTRNEQVLLIFNKSFKTSKFEFPQLASNFQYNLGSYLPKAIENSLKDLFNVVDTANGSIQTDNYHLVIEPEIVSFEAEVPPLIFMNTKSKIRINYIVKQRRSQSQYTIEGYGDYEFKNRDTQLKANEKVSLKRDDRSEGMDLTSYQILAGQDTAFAVKDCLMDLEVKLIAILDKQ